MSFDPWAYDRYVVYFSGGKDSWSSVLLLLEMGIERERIELQHHLVDGREGSSLVDWPCTAGYCKAAAAALDLPIYFSWRQGGFEREMLRQDESTAPTMFEMPCALFDRIDVGHVGGNGPRNTRLKFPQVSADLRVRWCSGYLKINVGRSAITNQERFKGIRTLTITGERADESTNRARYQLFEPENHQAGRHVDRWRPVHSWSLADVWLMMERWRVNPHPAYRLGWGRTSCQFCIFGSKNQWASNRQISPVRFERISDYERAFGWTIQRDRSIIELAEVGTAYDMSDPDIRAALSVEWTEPIFLPDGQWVLPAGAFGEMHGPS